MLYYIYIYTEWKDYFEFRNVFPLFFLIMDPVLVYYKPVNKNTYMEIFIYPENNRSLGVQQHDRSEREKYRYGKKYEREAPTVGASSSTRKR